MHYKTGFDFWDDLRMQYGAAEAKKVANSYLDLPLGRSDTEEYTFRCELYRATCQQVFVDNSN